MYVHVCMYTKNCTVIRYNDKQHVVNLLHLLSHIQGGTEFFVVEYLPVYHMLFIIVSNYSAVVDIYIYIWCFGENCCLHLEGRSEYFWDVVALYMQKVIPLYAKQVDRRQKCSCTHSWPWRKNRVGGHCHALAALPAGMRPSTLVFKQGSH